MYTLLRNLFRFKNRYRGLSVIKTVYFNLCYFPFRQAMKMPVWINRNVTLASTKGKVILNGNLSSGMVKIGFHVPPVLFDYRGSRTIWNVTGSVEIGVNVFIGGGSTIFVTGRLTFGDHVFITGKTSILSALSIEFGKNCIVSWDNLIMDHDGHIIVQRGIGLTNPAKAISFGDRVWIGCRCLLMKGTKVEDGCIIAANSFINKEIFGTNQLMAGNPAKVVKSGVRWLP